MSVYIDMYVGRSGKEVTHLTLRHIHKQVVETTDDTSSEEVDSSEIVLGSHEDCRATLVCL